MAWAFWRRRPRSPQYPRLVFESREGGVINVTADWPDAPTAEERADVAQSVATMTWFLCDGQLMSLIQEAIAAAGSLKKQEDMSRHAFSCLNWAMTRSGNGGVGKAAGGPLVPPDEVFNAGGDR